MDTTLRSPRWLHLVLIVAMCAMASCGDDDTTKGDGSGDADTDPINPFAEVVEHEDILDPDTAPDTIDPGGDVTGEATGDTAPLDGTADTDPTTDVDEHLDADTGEPIPEWGLEIDPVLDGATVDGKVAIAILPTGVDELVVDQVSLSLDGEIIDIDGKLPTFLVLDTAQYDDGPHELFAFGMLGDTSADDLVTTTFANPGIAVDQVWADKMSYTNGDTINVTVRASEAGLTVTADFSTIDSGYLPESVTVADQGTGDYLVSYTLTSGNDIPDGTYEATITLSGEAGDLDYSDLSLRLSNEPIVPLYVKGAIFVDDEPPLGIPLVNAPVMDTVNGSQYLITGGGATINTVFHDPNGTSSIVGLLVWCPGRRGYLQRPLQNTTGSEQLTVILRGDLLGTPVPDTLEVKVAVKDTTGNVSPPKSITFDLIEVLSGEVQVSIFWDTDNDVDLHVIEPTGDEIYYGDDESSSGGVLDLDSNPGCSIDGKNNENISWPSGQAPQGKYTVKVDYYSDCSYYGPGGNVDWTVVVYYCDTVEIYTGHFAAGTDDSGGSGSGVLVATFDTTKCASLVEGNAYYEDHVYNRKGFSGWDFKPIRYAQVEVVREADGEVLAVGQTDDEGHYSIGYYNNGEPGVRVQVVSRVPDDDDVRTLEVFNHPKFKKLYVKPAATIIDETVTPKAEVDILVLRDDDAGAFNVFDVILDGLDALLLLTGEGHEELEVYWQEGADLFTSYCGQWEYDQGLCSPPVSIQISGIHEKPDEYDDAVILREFFMFVLDEFSREDDPGSDSIGIREAPTKAWVEGAATYLACHALETPFFVDSGIGGVYHVLNLDVLDSPFTLATSSGLLGGDVSYYLVASLLWDMHDDSTTEEFDALSNGDAGIFESIFGYLPSTSFMDRGAPGVDLTDFLDGWFCRGYGQLSSMSALLNALDFPYDYASPSSCQ